MYRVRKVLHILVISVLCSHISFGQQPAGINAQQETEDRYRKKIEANIIWLKRNNIQLNTLPKANPDDFMYNCDSSLLLKKIMGDTLILWLPGSFTYLDTIRIKEWMKIDQYGKTDYIQGVNYQGNISYASLSKHTFLIREDSLYELVTFRNISSDSTSNLFDLLFENSNDEKKIDSIGKILKSITYYRFKLIFHPAIFTDDLYKGNIKGDVIELNTQLKIGDLNYYKISVTNKLGDTKTRYSYSFDEHFKFLLYDGCNKEEMKALNKSK